MPTKKSDFKWLPPLIAPTAYHPLPSIFQIPYQRSHDDIRLPAIVPPMPKKIAHLPMSNPPPPKKQKIILPRLKETEFECLHRPHVIISGRLQDKIVEQFKEKEEAVTCPASSLTYRVR